MAAAATESQVKWAGEEKLVAALQDVRTAPTKEAVRIAAYKLIGEVKHFLDVHGKQVCYAAKSFGTKGRFAWVAWWYSTPETKRTEAWLETQVHPDGMEMRRCTERDIEAGDWSTLAPEGNVSPFFVKKLASLTASLKKEFVTWDTEKHRFDADDELGVLLSVPSDDKVAVGGKRKGTSSDAPDSKKPKAQEA